MINNRYIIKKKLGEGRSKVFSAIDIEFPDKEIAIKILPLSAKPDEKEFFRDEFFRIKKFDHPNIIKAFEFGTVVTKDAEDLEIEYGSDFITLEYFPSKELLAYTELIDEKKLREILQQLCAVLYYLHQSNYIYYDLKPENILVSNIGNRPRIKLIDFGLAEYQLKDLKLEVKGTAHYIAPELLKKEEHDHTVDLYSLGILLYRIIYGRFPFSAESEVDIYKAQIEQQFIFPPSRYSQELVTVTKKLLNKEARLRYQNSLEVLEELGIEINLELTKDFLPAKFFSNRKDAVNIIRSYLADTKNNEIYCVQGAEGSGKTALFIEIYENFENTILIENFSSKSGIDAVKYISRKIFYSKVLYEKYTQELTRELPALFDSEKEEFIQRIKVFADSALKSSKPVILIDDFNLYDDFVKEFFREILPVFQINETKVIISENTNLASSCSLFANIREFQITHFTDSQLADFIEISYWQNFPKKELKKIIGLYSDLLPGNVKQFIKDLIVLGILKYSGKKIIFEVSEELEITLRSSNEEIYRVRLSNLTAEELKLAQLISAFEIGIEQTVLAGILGVNADKIKELISGLEKKNIIDSLNLSNTPKINSFSFKTYIYSTISSRTKYHLVVANTIKKLFPKFNTIELARQFELAGEYEKSAEVLKKEIEAAERISAFSYKRTLLEKVLSFNLTPQTKQEFLIELIKTNYKLSDYKAVVEKIKLITLENLSAGTKDEILLVQGNSLVEMQELEPAKKLLNLLLTTKDHNKVYEAQLLAANIEISLNNYDAAFTILKSLLNDSQTLPEIKAEAHNLLAMIYYYKGDVENSLIESQKSIKIFNELGMKLKVSSQLINMGTLCFGMDNPKLAFDYWDRALYINKEIGNLRQKALVLLNWGVALLNSNKLEEAIKKLNESKNILKIIYDKNLYSLCLYNLGEAYLKSCDYQNAYESLTEAQEKFSLIENDDETLRALFLLGKFWFFIGDDTELEKILNQFEYYSYTKLSFTDEHALSYEFLKIMLVILKNENIFSDRVLYLLEKTNESNFTLFGDLILNILETLCFDKRSSDVLFFLKHPVFDLLISKNPFFEAYTEYIRGLIVRYDKMEGMKSPLEYFESAFSKLESESISELTWKVLIATTEVYIERGNYHKAKKPRIYAWELINLIAESVTNPRIRVKYLEKRERKNALDLLKKLNDKVKENEFQQS
ncbi:protein kinase domain-containing protein [Ignavibacterium album]|uniref:protein kinase domain-containing protein n=1 Tax=Ignavibacterium album TaxID=591197 RepID=UPI0035B8AE3C